MRPRLTSRVFILSLLTTLGAVPSQANIIGNDTQTFNPTTSGLDFVTVQSSQTLEPGVLNLGYFLNTARNVLPDTVDSQGAVKASKDTLWAQDFDFGYGLAEDLDAGVNFSHIISQSTTRPEPGAQFSTTGLNEIRLNLKYRVMAREPLGISIVPSVNFNQVKNNPFLGVDSGPTLNLEVALDRVIGPVLVGANAGYRFRTAGGAIPGSVYSPVSNQMIASLASSYYLPSFDTKLIAELIAAYQTEKSELLNADRLAMETSFGAKYDATSSLAVHAGLGVRVTDGLFSPDIRAYVGVNYAFIAHAFDTIQTRNTVEGDSLTSVSSYTTEETKIYQGFQPKEIEAMAAQPFDQLAREHEFSLRRAVDLNESADLKPPFEIVRLDGLNFDTARFEIKERHKELLTKLLSYLNSEPRVLKIRVEGHTDSLGHEHRNATLSANRASAVRDYLKRSGLSDAIEVESIGYGSSKPIADNSNFQGREANRRVEVRLLRTIKPKQPKIFKKES